MRSDGPVVSVHRHTSPLDTHTPTLLHCLQVSEHIANIFFDDDLVPLLKFAVPSFPLLLLCSPWYLFSNGLLIIHCSSAAIDWRRLRKLNKENTLLISWPNCLPLN